MPLTIVIGESMSTGSDSEEVSNRFMVGGGAGAGGDGGGGGWGHWSGVSEEMLTYNENRNRGGGGGGGGNRVLLYVAVSALAVAIALLAVRWRRNLGYGRRSDPVMIGDDACWGDGTRSAGDGIGDGNGVDPLGTTGISDLELSDRGPYMDHPDPIVVT